MLGRTRKKLQSFVLKLFVSEANKRKRSEAILFLSWKACLLLLCSHAPRRAPGWCALAVRIGCVVKNTYKNTTDSRVYNNSCLLHRCLAVCCEGNEIAHLRLLWQPIDGRTEVPSSNKCWLDESRSLGCISSLSLRQGLNEAQTAEKNLSVLTFCITRIIVEKVECTHTCCAMCTRSRFLPKGVAFPF